MEEQSEESVKVLVKVLQSSEDLLLILPLDISVKEIKSHIETNHSKKPSAKHQSIMYKGQILSDDSVLEELLTGKPLLEEVVFYANCTKFLTEVEETKADETLPVPEDKLENYLEYHSQILYHLGNIMHREHEDPSKLNMLHNLPVMHPEFQRRVQEYVKEKNLTSEEDIIIPKLLSEFPGYYSMIRINQLLFMFAITSSLSRYSHPLWLTILVIIEFVYYYFSVKQYYKYNYRRLLRKYNLLNEGPDRRHERRIKRALRKQTRVPFLGAVSELILSFVYSFHPDYIKSYLRELKEVEEAEKKRIEEMVKKVAEQEKQKEEEKRPLADIAEEGAKEQPKEEEDSEEMEEEAQAEAEDIEEEELNMVVNEEEEEDAQFFI